MVDRMVISKEGPEPNHDSVLYITCGAVAIAKTALQRSHSTPEGVARLAGDLIAQAFKKGSLAADELRRDLAEYGRHHLSTNPGG